MTELAAGTRLGKYKVVRLIGAGAMGTVYEGEHTESGTRVAIKVLDPRLAAASEASARFRFEGWITGRVRHPHVVDVMEVGDDGGHRYLVMELLSGEDLARRLERSGPLPVEETADILIPVCAAVARAHRAGITHRDLKPHNIFLAERDGAVHPKVLDFGIAISQASETPPPETGAKKAVPSLVGSPCYLAPEQVVSSRAAGPATDQYALGVIAYECVTGRRPFDGTNLNAVLQAIAAGNPPAPSELRPALPAGLEQVVLRAMSREPSGRFASVTELGRALLPFASARVRLGWEGTFANQDADTKIEVAPPSPAPGAEQRWSSAGLRTRIGAAGRRSPSAPSIEAEAATPSPFVRTLPPEVPELLEVSEPSLVPPVALDLPDEEPSGVPDPQLRLSSRLGPLLGSKWVRSAGAAIVLGGLALLLTRAGSGGSKPTDLVPASSQTRAPEPRAEAPAAPAPAELGEAVQAEAAKAVPAVDAPPTENPAPPAEAVPGEKPALEAEGASPEKLDVPAIAQPTAEIARPASIRGAGEKTKTTRDAGARRKRRVPLLD